MTKKILIISAFLGLVAASRAEAQKKGPATLTPADGLKWEDAPNTDGKVKFTVVEGDATKGAHHAFHKFTAGFAAPVHHHTADHHVAVITGNLVLTVDGKDTKLGPGSFFSFTNKAKHATKCEAGADCLLFIDCRGKWDVVMADAKPADKTPPKKDK